MAARVVPVGELKRYRRKVETVTAVQFVLDQQPWPHGIEKDAKNGSFYADIGTPMRCRVKPGDWLVTFDDKHKTTIRVASDLFPKMYEPLPLKGD